MTIVGRRFIVRDMQSRLASFGPIMEALDTRVRRGTRIYVRPVRHRRPSELAGVLRDTLNPLPKGSVLRVIPDDRSGRLIVQTSPSRYRQADGLLRRLDRPHSGGNRIFLMEGADRAKALGWTR